MKRHPGVAALFWLLLPGLAAAPAHSQNLDSLLAVWERRVESAASTAQQVPALAEYARLLNRAGRYTEALDAISEAAQLRSLPSAVDIRPGLLPDTLEPTRRIVLIRAVAQEGLSQFAEARNDYRTLLAVDPDSEIAAAIRERVDHVALGAVADLATLARFSPEDLIRFYDSGSAHSRIAVLPFFNDSDNLLWNFVGYALAGYLSQAISMLGNMVDVPLNPVPRAETMSALNSVSLGRFYSDEAPITPTQVGIILGSQFSITGKVDSGPGGLGLRITPYIGTPDSESVVEIETLEDSSLPEGLERLQIDLALTVADQLQETVGFSYLDSREAFADSLRSIILPDLQRFVAYGRSVELSLAGDFEAAGPLLDGSHPPLALLDRPVLQAMARAGTSTLVALAQIERLIVPEEAVLPEDQPVTSRPARTPRVRPEPASRAAPPASLLGLLNAASQTVLGSSAIDQTRVGADVPPSAGHGSADPRDGVEGLNRIEPGRTTIQVIIPVPPPAGARQN
jgi:tetratricopeptide (TPR) repeat protein